MKAIIIPLQLGLLLLLCACNKTPVLPSTLTPSESQSLAASFARLERALATNAPSLLASLAPPATANEIVNLRSAIGGSKIDALEAWYGWHNGTTNRMAYLLPLGRPLPIDAALHERKQIQLVPLVEKWRKSVVMLMEDGAGDGFFFDVTSANPVVMYYMLENPYPQSYGTLEQFVNFIAAGFEQRIFFLNAEGHIAEDQSKYQAFEKAHFESILKRR